MDQLVSRHTLYTHARTLLALSLRPHEVCTKAGTEISSLNIAVQGMPWPMFINVLHISKCSAWLSATQILP